MSKTTDGITLRMEDLVSGGRGLAHLDNGKVVFVDGALAGELVRAGITKEKKDYALAVCREVLEPSEFRVEPVCPLYGSCGGCDLMHLEYGAQAQAKAAWLTAALHRLPGIMPPEILSGPGMGWRSRLRFQIEAGKLGFHARQSHRLVPLTGCPVALPAVNRLLPGLTSLLATTAGRQAAWVEVLAGEEGEEAPVYLTLGLRSRDFPRGKAMEAFQDLAARAGAAGVRLEAGGKLSPWRFQDGGVDYHESPRLTAFPGLFSQVNPGMNRLLIRTVVKACGGAPPGPALDLYAGSGNLTLPLAAAGREVLGVEGQAEAAAALIGQAEREGLEGLVKARAAGAEEALGELNRRGEKFPLVVLDPPRAGAPGLMGALARLEPRRLIYVSCHPAALARDAAELMGLGFVPAGLWMAGMFPQTSQVEAVLVLDRS